MTVLFSLAILFMLGFIVFCSILGINSRRQERAQRFMENLIAADYKTAFAVLSPDYKRQFNDQEDLFRFAAQAFVVSMFPDQVINDGDFPFRFHPMGPFLLHQKSRQQVKITLLIIQTQRSRLAEVKDMILLKIRPSLYRQKKSKISVGMIYKDNKWEITNCRSEDLGLAPLTLTTCAVLSRILTSEQLLHLGNLLYQSRKQSEAMLCYDELYHRLQNWDEDTQRAFQRLSEYWLEKGNARGAVLQQQLIHRGQK
ncbi:hypothetical protein ACFL27_18225 [candidate division CSSED10-310 bacterium]|uniref:SnoaL-like domain-containing protein n=1 Tax=candidate division CSSED10-310 bacterium TaxID=2855610 RepID=A0ABV6Z111_UNCC1